MKLSALTLSLLITSALPGTTLYRVASGSVAGAADAQGNFWQADAYFSAGSFLWTQNPGPAVPYLSLRYAPAFSYTFQLQANTQYSITLKFLEPNKTAAGQRLFSVAFNNVVQIQSFDIFATAGALTPLDKSFPFLSPANGQLVISFQASVGNAVVSAIQIDDVPIIAGVPSCLMNTIDYTAMNAAGNSQEFPLFNNLPGSFRYLSVLVSEHVRFAGPQLSALSVSIGRSGTNNSEITGRVPMMESSGDANFFPVSGPPPPQITGTYNLVLNVISTGIPLNQLTGGQVIYQICGYDTGITPAQVATANAQLNNLSKCSGSTSPTSVCDGLWQATISLPGGKPINIAGVEMPLMTSANWSSVAVQ